MSDSDVLHIIEQIRAAGSQREIAGYLLRVPDCFVVTHGVQLMAECARQVFSGGLTFVQLRLALLTHVRDGHGLLPEWLAREVELWRFTLSEFAAGKGDGLPSFMRGADGPQG